MEKLQNRQELILPLGERNFSISYSDNMVDAPPVVLLHGLAPSGSETFCEMLAEMPKNFRYIAVDLKGFGCSDNSDAKEMSVYHQAVIVQELIRVLRLENITLIGHFTGGTIALIAMFNRQFSGRVAKLVLIGAAGMNSTTPKLVKSLSSADNIFQQYSNKHIAGYIFFNEQFADNRKITESAVNRCAGFLSNERTIECITAAADQFIIQDSLDFQRRLAEVQQPVLILWGELDKVLELENAFAFHRYLPHSQVRIIPRSGHAPHMESPHESAAVIAGFLGAPLPGQGEFDFNRNVAEFNLPLKSEEVRSPKKTQNSPYHSGRKLRMSRLIDNWNITTVICLVFMKFLQLLKKCGMKAEENGWRAATGIFLRNEYSKFMLGTFRLRYYNDYMQPQTTTDAREQLIRRLHEFLCNQEGYYWAVEPGVMKLKRRKVFFIDIVEATYDSHGKIISLKPFFDPRQSGFQALTKSQITMVLNRFTQEYNALLSTSDRVRPQELLLRLKFWIGRIKDINIPGRLELKILLDRLMTATFIHFEYDCNETIRKRLRTPDLKNRKHPGWGLLNIFCRFTSDLSETDLWFQYHHVPVDGMPMQEILEKLKKQWGSAGPTLYPALCSPEARPEIIYCGDRIFRARIFVNFEPMLKLRKYLNTHYSTIMEGPATIAGMVIWGMMQHEYFRDNKFLFPVDLAAPEEASKERELSLVFIRPSQYLYEDRRLGSFILFQREFNRRLFSTRLGVSESYELLELYSMINPIFYYIGRYLMPKAVGDILGTMGLSIIKNAEIFVSPLSDLQLKGFMAIGNLTVPTEDGKSAGAVSICATREQIKYYIRAVTNLSVQYLEFLDISEETLEDGQASPVPNKI